MKKIILLGVICLATLTSIYAQSIGNQFFESRKGSRHTTTSSVAINLKSDSTLMLTNLVIFVKFADDEEITQSFSTIDTIFNLREPGFLSVYNFFKASTYGKIEFNTVYASQVDGEQIISFTDKHPRGYFQPYSATNTIGYQGELPFEGISKRERELLADAIRYVDSLHLVDTNIVIDGNNDGYIDNISFVVKGDTGKWADLLWPHMEYFPLDSLDYPLTINGIKPNAFNFELEGAGKDCFCANTFCHEMHHSLGVPDLYHYINYLDITPAGPFDIMCYGWPNTQTSAMIKSRYLHVCDDPIEITKDGTYTLLSNGSSPTRNCYYIKSSIDSTQWFTFEFRNQYDRFDRGTNSTSGLIAGRWDNAIPNDYESMFTNPYFDNEEHKHLYWVFRPGSSSDIENGNIFGAPFGQYSGRTKFGPNTSPFPYLTDGRPEQSFELTNITVYRDSLTFKVHFFENGIAQNSSLNSVKAYPNPATDVINLSGKMMKQIEVYNPMGQLLTKIDGLNDEQYALSINDFPSGLLIIRITHTDGSVSAKKAIKK